MKFIVYRIKYLIKIDLILRNGIIKVTIKKFKLRLIIIIKR